MKALVARIGRGLGIVMGVLVLAGGAQLNANGSRAGHLAIRKKRNRPTIRNQTDHEGGFVVEA